MRKIILIIGGIISLVACSHDPINEVLDNKKIYQRKKIEQLAGISHSLSLVRK